VEKRKEGLEVGAGEGGNRRMVSEEWRASMGTEGGGGAEKWDG